MVTIPRAGTVPTPLGLFDEKRWWSCGCTLSDGTRRLHVRGGVDGNRCPACGRLEADADTPQPAAVERQVKKVAGTTRREQAARRWRTAFYDEVTGLDMPEAVQRKLVEVAGLWMHAEMEYLGERHKPPCSMCEQYDTDLYCDVCAAAFGECTDCGEGNDVLQCPECWEASQ